MEAVHVHSARDHASPRFRLDARIAMMPGVPVRVHDAYIAGRGTLHAAVFGLVSVVNVRDTTELGELMRFLAEAAWYPTSLLPSQGVRWEAADDHSARATLEDGTSPSRCCSVSVRTV
jgi:hypothetical protein